MIIDQAYAFTQEVYFASCCLNPAAYDVFVTKLCYIYPELKMMGIRFIMSNAPGESYQIIKSFNFTKLKRLIYPIDDI